MSKLSHMPKPEFDTYFDRLVRKYATDKMREGSWSEKDIRANQWRQ